MICPACSGDSPSLKDRTKAATCDDCFVENSDYFKESEELMDQHCSCHAAKHNKSMIKKPGHSHVLDEIEKDNVRKEKENAETLAKIEANRERYEKEKYEKSVES